MTSAGAAGAPRVILIGATGRMGQAIVRSAVGEHSAQVVAGIASAGSKSSGRDLGEVAGVTALGVLVRDQIPADLAQAQVAIDFSRPELSGQALMACRRARVPLVIGTTGHGADFDAQLREAAREIPVLLAPNTSLGVALAQELVRIAARALPGFDIEIFEAHHKHKLDAPSGTALALAHSAAEGRGLDPARHVVAGREGQGLRQEGEIGIASLRGGDIVGSHTVWFAGPGERLTVGHEATDRSIFARGAIRAAVWLAAQPPGRYSMSHVLGLKTIS